MMQKISFRRYTCDICKKQIDDFNGRENILSELHLPMDYLSEDGGFEKITVDKLEACPDCVRQMVEDLKEHYEISSRRYVGVTASRKGGINNG